MNNVKTFVLMAGLLGLFLLVGQLIGGIQRPDRGPGVRQPLQLHHVLLLRPAGPQDVRGPGGHGPGSARALRAWWTGCGSGPACPCRPSRSRPHEQPNAFATGRNPEHAVVAVTTGILKYMPQEELEGVIAHELAHIKNRDMLISTVAAGIAGAISIPALPAHVRRRPRR